MYDGSDKGNVTRGRDESLWFRMKKIAESSSFFLNLRQKGTNIRYCKRNI